MKPDERLQRLLGGEHLASLRKRLRQRFERAVLDEGIESFRISKLTADEHSALAALLGRPPRFANSMLIDIRTIDTALQQVGIATSLRNALEQLDGPIIHRATARSQLQTLWAQVVDSVNHPGLTQLLQVPTGIGLLKRLTSQNPEEAILLCCRADAVLQNLPANGLTRAQLSANVLGDAHALDNGQAVATLVLAVWRQIIAPTQQDLEESLPDFVGEESVRQENHGERARDIWAMAGVLVNELARPAMFLNLPTSEAVSYAQAPGEPGYVSLRAILRSPPQWAVAGRNVYICENPNLLAIVADQLGPRCSPMVCIDGMPAAAQRRLLTQLAKAGAFLRYHGDFDWPGLSIGNYVMREFGAKPWRFGVGDYLAAVRSAPPHGRQLGEMKVDAVWDNELSTAMFEHQLAIDEEMVAHLLMMDLDESSC